MSTMWKVLMPVLPIVLLVFHGEAWALQSHAEPEGLVVHQLAHLQYIAALGYLFWDIRRSGFAGRGWVYLQRFCLLMALWNAIAFTGHFAALSLSEDALIKGSGHLATLLTLPVTLKKVLFYVTALDHLVCAPALFFLYLAMRTFYKASEQDGPEDGV